MSNININPEEYFILKLKEREIPTRLNRTVMKSYFNLIKKDLNYTNVELNEFIDLYFDYIGIYNPSFTHFQKIIGFIKELRSIFNQMPEFEELLININKYIKQKYNIIYQLNYHYLNFIKDVGNYNDVKDYLYDYIDFHIQNYKETTTLFSKQSFRFFIDKINEMGGLKSYKIDNYIKQHKETLKQQALKLKNLSIKLWKYEKDALNKYKLKLDNIEYNDKLLKEMEHKLQEYKKKR